MGQSAVSQGVASVVRKKGPWGHDRNIRPNFLRRGLLIYYRDIHKGWSTTKRIGTRSGVVWYNNSK